MTFKEKIDKILSVNTLGINSVTALEDEVGASRSSINEFYKQNKNPGRLTEKRIKSFKDLNHVWWETGKGDVFINSATVKDNPETNSTNNGNNVADDSNDDTPYRDLIKDSDYALIPKSLLGKEEYRILLKSELDGRTEVWGRALDGRDELIAELRTTKQQIIDQFKKELEISHDIVDKLKLTLEETKDSLKKLEVKYDKLEVENEKLRNRIFDSPLRKIKA